MRLRLSTRLILSVGLIQIAMCSLLVWNSVRLIDASHGELLEHAARAETELLAASLAPALLTDDRALLRDALALNESHPEFAYADVFDTDGVHKGSLHGVHDIRAPHDADYAAARADGIYDMAVPIMLGGRTLGSLHVGISIRTAETLARKTRTQNSLIAAAGLAISMLITVMLSLWLTRNLRRLELGAQALQQDWLDFRLDIRGGDEIGAVAQAFDRLAAHLGETRSALLEKQRLLEQQTEHLRALIDGVGAVITEGDPQSCSYTYVSREAENLLGYPLADWYNPGCCMDHIHPEDRPKLGAALNAHLPGPATFALDYRLLHRDGHIVWVRSIVNIRPRPDGDGAACIGLLIDISERMQTMEALRRSEARLKEAQSLAHIGSWELDLVNNQLDWSDEIYRIFGIAPQAFAATYEAFLDIVYPDDRERVIRAYNDSVLNRTPYDLVHRIQPPDGTLKYVHERCETFYAADGTPLRSLGTVQDITERVRAENVLALRLAELKQAEERQRELLTLAQREQGRMAALLSGMSIGILFEDRAGRVEYVNPSFRRMWAIQDDVELVGRPTRSVLENSTHRFARPDHASKHVLHVLDTHEISERFEVDLYDGRVLTQLSYPVADPEGRIIGRLWIYEDVTHERQTAQQLVYLAERDPLTGLHNRHRFQEQLEWMINTSRRNGTQFALLYFDLDEFKYINDTFGHRAGDTVLVRTAGEVASLIRSGEMFARLGGDEFAILTDFQERAETTALSERIVHAISAIPFRFRGSNLRLTASIGIAIFPHHGDNAEDLVAHADTAMYQAKNLGKNTWALYDPQRDASQAMVERMTWTSRIGAALERGLFELHFQGIYCTHDRSLSHLEALVRMRDPAAPDQLIMPGQFIPVAEKSGQILEIDRWVLEHSIQTLAQQPHLAGLAVNVSGRSFDQPSLPGFIRELLERHAVAPERLIIELTETAAVSEMQDAQRFIEALQQTGCTVCLDDFGTGFSTFAYLKYLGVQMLKIDGMFIRDLPNNPDNQAFVKAMMDVARGLHKIAVAEFVEDGATLEKLVELGVDLAQGYFLDRPSARHPALE